MSAMTHNELQDDLAAHLRGNTDRMVWTNTQLGPAASPRPDVFTLNKSYARFRADCYECKVSVSDLRSDVTSGKWQSYRKFGHAVWFAFPRGMAPLDLVPKECGIILRGEDKWRAARKPVVQVLDTLPRDAWLKLLIESYTESCIIRPRTASEWHARDAIARELGKEFAEMFQDRRLAESRYKSRTALLRVETEAVEQRIAEARQNAKEIEERVRYQLDDAMRSLALDLGIPEGEITAQALIRRLHDVRRKLGDHSILQAVGALNRIHNILAGAGEAA